MCCCSCDKFGMPFFVVEAVGVQPVLCIGHCEHHITCAVVGPAAVDASAGCERQGFAACMFCSSAAAPTTCACCCLL
jgi:hypothetical protein